MRGNVILVFSQNSSAKYHVYKEMQNAVMDGTMKGKFIMTRPMNITRLFLSTLVFADDTTKDGIISFKDPLGSSITLGPASA